MLGSAVDQDQRQTASLRLAEPVAALSLATDLGMGQPMDSVLLSAVLGVRLASLFGVSDAELSEVYYVALLRFVGCNADAHVAAETFGDELVAREHFAQREGGDGLRKAQRGLSRRGQRLSHGTCTARQQRLRWCRDRTGWR